MTAFTTLADLLRQLSTASGPRLTWYGAERIELSGPVLANWTVKTTNLLAEEFDARPGFRVGIDLPMHWRTVVWALAAWRTGATVIVAGDGTGDDADPNVGALDDARTHDAGTLTDVDLLVTDRPDRAPANVGDVVAVTLPALARSFPGELPPGATDAAAAVMTYGDQLGRVPDTDAESLALVDGPRTLTYAELATRPAGTATRRLLDGRRGTASVLLDALATWRAGGSVVLLDGPFAAELDADPQRRGRLLATEHVDQDVDA